MKKLTIGLALVLTSVNLSSQTWQYLTTGLGPGSTTQEALCLTVYNNKLIVGGGFASAGGNSADNIAAWDGSNWSTLNTGLQGNFNYKIVRALTVYNSNLIAAGVFTAANTTTLCNIGLWNGTNWSSINNSMTDVGTNPMVNALTVYNSKLIVAGSFTNISGTNALNIAQWDGSSWTPLGTGIQGSNAFGVIKALTVFNNELYAAGTFTMAGATTVNNIAKWNGTNWTAVGSGIPSCNSGNYGINSLCVYNNELYAGNCNTGVSKWNGTNWVSVGGGLSSTGGGFGGFSMVVYNNKLIVGGFFMYAGLDLMYNIAAWDGSTWSYVGGVQNNNGFDQAVNALEVYNSCLYAGGIFNTAHDNIPKTNMHGVANFCGTIGIEEYAMNNQVVLSPNPSNGQFTFTDLIGTNNVEVYDMTSRLIYTAINTEDKLTLDLSTKDKGVYFYRITDRDKKVQQGKLILQ